MQVSFYKQYRDILISDIIHVVSVAACTTAACRVVTERHATCCTQQQRRADMQSIDCFMHANPFIANRGMKRGCGAHTLVLCISSKISTVCECVRV